MSWSGSSPSLLAPLPALALGLSLGLSACGGDDAPADASSETSSTSGDGDGDPATGDGDGDPMTGDGDGDGDPMTGDGDGDPPVELSWPLLDCDPLVPEYCAFPFPNNVYSVEDPAANTGRRLALSADTLPANNDPSHFNKSDGFSPSSTMLAFLPGGTTTGLPSSVTIEASLEPDSPTVVLDAETGERVPHWAEYDLSHDDDERRAFMIRPAVRLEPDTRYIVAIREVVDQDGVALPASPGFAALRDETPSDDDAIEDRRALYTDIFARLDDAGVARDDLQLAWDFTTASEANLTERAVAVVERGMAALPPEGPSYTIDNVTMDPAPGLAMQIEASVSVPLFLDMPETGGSFVYDDEGLPTQNGTAQWPVLIHVPDSAFDEPAPVMAYGHGMLGSRWEIQADHLEAIAADANIIVFATDWDGFAEADADTVVQILASGQVADWYQIADRLQQGFLNAFVAMRMMLTTFVDEPLMQGNAGSMIDPEHAWYFGGSQGGIFGSPYLALSPDVTRGVLAVPGQPYSLLLNRSVNFEPFYELLTPLFPDGLDLRFLIELIQIEWDRAEPSIYSRHLIDDPLPNAFEKEVLMLVSIGDHQVTTLGAHMMAREIGVPQIAPAPRPDLFGIDTVEQPYMGSAMIEYDWGLPPEPVGNLPMSEGEDPHGKLADSVEATMTVEQFLRTGVVETFCDGVCDPD